MMDDLDIMDVAAGVDVSAGDDVADQLEQSPELPSEPIPLEVVGDDWELEGIEVYAMPPITTATGFKGLLYKVVGPYDTIITQYTYKQNGNTYYSYVNDISPDYPWMISAALLVVLVYCTFRALGGLLAWRR